jgi:aryl-alcohol dehydrogenase-like predicted oxidoreductase
MEYVNLGRSDLKVSVIGLGAWQAGAKGWGKILDSDVKNAILTSIEMGLNFIDTAEVYGEGHSETVIGEVIKDFRDDVIIATKASGNHLKPEYLERALEGSLKRLKTSYVDLYQIHWPDIYTPIKGTMKTLEKMANDGKIRYIGLSNFSICQIEEARSYLSGMDVVSNQVRYNILQREIEDEMLPYLSKEKISVIAYSPLAQGLLSFKYDHATFEPSDVRKSNKLFSEQNIKTVSSFLSVLKDISLETGHSIVQLALNWLISRGNVIPIPGAKNRDQATINLQSNGWRLTAEQNRRIEEEYLAIKDKLDTF